MTNTKIEWATKAWNIVEGCTKVSTGCKHCYAERLSKRMRRDFSKVELHPERLDQPRHWRDSQTVFVCSRSDPFHREVPSEFLSRAFDVMRETPQHRYLLLTKRPELAYTTWNWPENVWLGVSVENQARADERIPLLLDTPAAVRFVSAEPLLGPLDLWGPRYQVPEGGRGSAFNWGRGISWVIVGGESGGPENRQLVERCDCRARARKAKTPEELLDAFRHVSPCYGTPWRVKPEALKWVRDIRDQCQAAGVPFYFKQWGPRAGQGTLLDGNEHKEMPR